MQQLLGRLCDVGPEAVAVVACLDRRTPYAMHADGSSRCEACSTKTAGTHD
ncbi:hypothetical protein [Streptomyces milbemycinicus]|uniref:hypothetical protein n=1 Tax=Streptomyces milbemycinicus TaxID=476552 RepID=UPI0033E34F02